MDLYGFHTTNFTPRLLRWFNTFATWTPSIQMSTHDIYIYIMIFFDIHSLVMLHVSPHLGSVGSQSWSFPCWHPCAKRRLPIGTSDSSIMIAGGDQALEMDITRQFNQEFTMVSSNFGASNVPRKLESFQKICNLSGTTSSKISPLQNQTSWCPHSTSYSFSIDFSKHRKLKSKQI